MSLLFRPVFFANSLSSEDIFSGKLMDKTDRITHLLYYNTLHPPILSRVKMNPNPDLENVSFSELPSPCGRGQRGEG
jgi:hypothetical protein